MCSVLIAGILSDIGLSSGATYKSTIPGLNISNTHSDLSGTILSTPKSARNVPDLLLSYGDSITAEDAARLFVEDIVNTESLSLIWLIFTL